MSDVLAQLRRGRLTGIPSKQLAETAAREAERDATKGELVRVMAAGAARRAGSPDGAWLQSRSRAIAGCREMRAFREAGCGIYLTRPLSCRVRGCPSCEAARSTRLERIYLAAAEAMRWPALVTLTIPNVPAEGVDDAIDRLQAGFDRLRARKIFRGGACKDWRTRHETDPAWTPVRQEPDAKGRRRWVPRKGGHWVVPGGIYSIEVTYNEATDLYHPHLHALIDSRWMLRTELRDAWAKVMGSAGELRVDIRRVKRADRRGAIRETLKYVTKPSRELITEREPERFVRLALALRGRRLVNGFGAWRGIPDVDDPEPETVRVTDPSDPFRFDDLPAVCPFCKGAAAWDPPVYVARTEGRSLGPKLPVAWLPRSRAAPS